MSRIAYVNGRFLPHSHAEVHVEDRGYQFADGVYEVVLVQNGVMVDEMPHLDRLDRSLDELRIAHPMSRGALRSVMRELVRLNRIRNGLVYMQVTRGVAKRDHPFPKNAKPSIVLTAKRISMPSQETVENGVKVITIRDIRWERCDIKSVSLLPNILGKQEARENGAFEAWQVDAEGNVASVTTSINLGFGARFSAAGYALNDQLDDFARPGGEPNAFGLRGGAPNLPGPGRRPVSSATPLIVLRDGVPVLCAGGSGGSRIITATEQAALLALVLGRSPADAVASRRVHHQGDPDDVLVEEGLDPELVRGLGARGHLMTRVSNLAAVQLIRIDEDGLRPASDARTTGGVAGR
ncbi:gamma-glutamyltransferase [Thalassobaculum salexigens]|uniref:gamma-glutamyltransferase n=1 Tax=Thalassobaculum salexigens TaxID=455360 RepID=UPI00248E405D|nr:gamma-glutamyltransferase [Thalassobaculum salexigens]